MKVEIFHISPLFPSSIHHSTIHYSHFSVHIYCTHTVCKALSSDFLLFMFFWLTFPIFPIPYLFPALLVVSNNKPSPTMTGLQFNLPYLINELHFHNIAQLICIQICLLPNNWDKGKIISVIIRERLLSI